MGNLQDIGLETGQESIERSIRRMDEKAEANSRQIGGSHYKQADGGEEHWDRVARLKLDYFQACITKYVERWKLKGGVQDLEKARHYLDKYIELETTKARKEVGNE